MTQMTFDRAIDIRTRQLHSRTPIFDPAVINEAIAVIAQGRPLGDAASRPVPFEAMCQCGLRYGMHRVNDYACMNQAWRPGNGQPQWLRDVFVRAA